MRLGWLRFLRLSVLTRLIKWFVVTCVVSAIALLVPVVYVEAGCRKAFTGDPYKSILTDATFLRSEANTYLTYPEWHIVYAYDGLAEAVKTKDEYAFDYALSVWRFWQSACALTRVAGQHGGADFGTRAMIHTIGVSFTVEMALKGAYEETVGRATAWWRGPEKAPQDRVVRKMAEDYSAFLRQTPWYRYPFAREARALWAAPIDQVVRGWERRLGIGLEFEAKAAYGRLLGKAVAATAPAQLEIRSIVRLDAQALSRIDDVKIIRDGSQGIEIETPRYDKFTRILIEIAKRGGKIVEIAGNDEIMVTLTAPDGGPAPEYGDVILRLPRDGFQGERLLMNVKMSDLASLLTTYPLADPGLEHVFDY